MIIRDITSGGAVRHPERAAVISGETRFTYRQLHQRSNRLANALAALGLVKGDIVSIYADNCAQYPEIAAACIKTGLATAPFMVSVPPADLPPMINNCRSKVVICSGRFLKDLQGVRSKLEHTEHFIALEDSDGQSLAYEALLAGASEDDPPVPDLTYDDLSYVGSTSGTTGLPKQTIRTYETTLAVGLEISYALDLKPDDVYFQPCTAIFGIGCWRLLFHLGCTCILPNDFSATSILSTIEKERVTKVFTSAGVIREVLNDPQLEAYDLSSLRRIWATGAPLSAEEWKRAIKVFGYNFLQAYSIQEQAPVTLLQPDDFRNALEGGQPQLLRSVGRPALGVKVSVVGPEGEPLGANELGEITTSGGNLIKGYLNNPAATAEAIKDGVFHTGDLGMFDGDGLLYLKGRKSDMVVVEGKVVLPQETEAVILRHSAVREVAVAGMPSGSGSKVVAFVVCTGGVDPEEVLALCRENVPSHAVPSEVVIVESFPKTASGKVMKHKLIEKYQ
ncbi:MAG: AMP-binding protein [Proteobacteria bacterium]|nr:AMP-binding protein [Pseudomonadota bacterium]MBU4597209.1 AMP-binding protein [Pseudomonadota bacterium]